MGNQDTKGLVWSEAKASGISPGTRSSHSCAILSKQNRFVVVGGDVNDPYQYTFDCRKNLWIKKPGLKVREHSCVIWTRKRGHTMIVFGGLKEDGKLSNEVFQLDVDRKNESWSLVDTNGKPPSPRRGHSAVMSKDQKFMYIFGGITKSGCVNELWQFNVIKKEWTEVIQGKVLPCERAFHTTIYIRRINKMLLFFGEANDKSVCGDVWEYDFGNGVWKEEAFSYQEKILPRHHHSCCLVESDNGVKILLGSGIFSPNIRIKSKQYKSSINAFWELDISKRRWNIISCTNNQLLYGYSMVCNKSDLYILGGAFVKAKRSRSRSSLFTKKRKGKEQFNQKLYQISLKILQYRTPELEKELLVRTKSVKLTPMKMFEMFNGSGGKKGASTLPRPKKIKRDPSKVWKMLEILGEGSYGVVYKAVNLRENKIYAVKRIATDNEMKEITTEIKVLKSCMSPYIVRYHYSFKHAGELWIIMEHCGGGSLVDCCTHLKHKFNEVELATIVYNIIRGVAYLHNKLIIHRNIKAGNILLTEHGDLKISDFGISTQLESDLHKHNTMIGSPYWMAPEVISENKYDTKADVWSIGITIIELAEGQAPLADTHPMRAIFTIPTNPSPTLKEPEKWSKELNDLISKCLQKDVSKRSTVEELLNHPFFEKKKHTSILVKYIDMLKEKFSAVGGRGNFLKLIEEEKKKNVLNDPNYKDSDSDLSDESDDSDISDDDGESSGDDLLLNAEYDETKGSKGMEKALQKKPTSLSKTKKKTKETITVNIMDEDNEKKKDDDPFTLSDDEDSDSDDELEFKSPSPKKRQPKKNIEKSPQKMDNSIKTIDTEDEKKAHEKLVKLYNFKTKNEIKDELLTLGDQLEKEIELTRKSYLLRKQALKLAIDKKKNK